MNYLGVVFDKVNFWQRQPDYQVEAAIVTDDRLILRWREDDTLFSCRLYSTDGGGFYEGLFGGPAPLDDWEMKAYRYSSPNGEVVLLIQWEQNDHGKEGCCVVRLTPQKPERRKQRR